MSERVVALTPAAVLDAVSRAIVATGTDGTILSWNRGAETLYGWTADEVLGRNVVEVLVPRTLTSQAGPALDRLRDGEEWSGELLAQHKDGRTLRVAVADRAVIDEDGQVVAIVAESEDIVAGSVADDERAHLLAVERSTRAEAETVATRLRGLQAVTMSLIRAVDARSVAEAVLTEGVPALGGHTGAICLVADDGETVEIVHEVGYSDEVKERWQSFPLAADLPASDAIRNAEIVVLNGREDRDAKYPAFQGAPMMTDDAIAVVPLIDEDGTAFGAMVVGFSRPGELTDGDLRVLSALAAQCATALRRAALYEEAREAAEAERDARLAAERAQQRLAFLAEASSALASSVLDLETTLGQVVELAVPRVADGCAIQLVDERGRSRPVAVTHTDPGKVEPLRRLAEKIGLAGGVVIGQSFADEVSGSTTVAQLPLRSQSVIVGMLILVAEGGRRIDEADLQLAEQLAVRAGIAIENARLFADRSRVARSLQASLLPPSLPTIPRLELGARYAPAGEGVEVGGDFYDAFAMGGGRWLLVVGDVRGKGVDAAAVTGLARHTIRSIALYEDRPSAILAHLNRVLLAAEADRVAALQPYDETPWELLEPRFCTVAIAIVEPRPNGAGVVVCSAGHPLPLVGRADGTVEAAGRPGSLLGASDDVDLHDVDVELGPGESLVCFTDGIVERHQGRQFFEESGIAGVLREEAGSDAPTLAARIEQAARNLFPDSPHDDMAVVVVRVPPA